MFVDTSGKWVLSEEKLAATKSKSLLTRVVLTTVLTFPIYEEVSLEPKNEKSRQVHLGAFADGWIFST